MSIKEINEIIGFTDFMDGGSISLHVKTESGEELEFFLDRAINSPSYGSVFYGGSSGELLPQFKLNILLERLHSIKNVSESHREGILEFINKASKSNV